MSIHEHLERISTEANRRVDRHGPAALRLSAGLLWLSNVSWKIPTDFGRAGDTCRGLCGYVTAGAEHPVFPGSAWFFREVVSPNLTAFGWTTLFVEATLAALLLSGRYLRIASVLGIGQSLGIMASVANAEHEWYWSYLLMAGLHLAVWLTAESAPRPSARTVGGWIVAAGVITAIANARRGFAGGDAGDWLLFGARNDLPGDFGRNVFPGSIALGLVFVIVGAVLILSDRLTPAMRLGGGWGLVGVAALMLVTYSADGTLIGLGARATSAALVATAGLALAVPSDRAGGEDALVGSG